MNEKQTISSSGSVDEEAHADRELAGLAALTPVPKKSPASGLYEYRVPPKLSLIQAQALSLDEAALIPVHPLLFREQLRLDVDGWYPQMQVSGTIYMGFAWSVHWIAELQASKPNTYSGTIWYKDGATGTFPYTKVTLHVAGGSSPATRTAVAQFTGGGAKPRTRIYRYVSSSFRKVDMEFDHQEAVAPTLSYEPFSHPNRPAGLPTKLTAPGVFTRSGFAVSSSGGSVPLAGAQADALWSNMEMHDTMQTYWSRYMPAAQWAVWVFTAGRHEWGSGLGGIMFDDIGTEHRQGTAIFNDSFISTPPAGDPKPTASVNRLRFWTTIHEIGHAFNLAHSWQKSLIHMGGGPWIPLADDPEARSFMNYPFAVSGGEASFFADFEFRFTDDELLFLRHAPERFVRQGDALWFDHHGFQQANTQPQATFSLEVRANREPATFQFLEPVTLELKLTNISSAPQVVDRFWLMPDGPTTVVTKRDGHPARQVLPFAHFCQRPEPKVLPPGEATYEPLQVSASPSGWGIAEPGMYTIQVALTLPTGEDIVSKPLRIRVASPQSADEDRLAGDFFSDEVARTLAFGGTRQLGHAIVTLQDVSDRLPERSVAIHANLALGRSVAREYKSIAEDPSDPRHPLGIKVDAPLLEEARRHLSAAMDGQPQRAAESLGHIRFRRRTEAFGRWLADHGDEAAAYKQVDVGIEALAAREIRGRRVKDQVIEEMRAVRDGLASRPNDSASRGRSRGQGRDRH